MLILKPESCQEARLEELYRVPENSKAEIVDGEIVLLPAVGELIGCACLAIAIRLKEYEKSAGLGRVFTSTVAFVVDLPHRKSFSPDVSFYVGPRAGMKFPQGAPLFAVEFRGENDYGSAAEREMAAKRADYFAAGTAVVWDVDLVGEETVRKYVASAPNAPIVFRRGETADAEPTLPGWTMPVDELFE